MSVYTSVKLLRNKNPDLQLKQNTNCKFVAYLNDADDSPCTWGCPQQLQAFDDSFKEKQYFRNFYPLGFGTCA